MEKTEMMKQFEADTGLEAIYHSAWGDEVSSDYLKAVEAKANAYDRLMSGNVKMTMQEMANFIGRAITVNKEGGVTAHGSMPRIVNTWLGECWYNEADEYMEINESFVDFTGDWKDSLTLPDGWEGK